MPSADRPPLRNPYDVFTGSQLDSFVDSIRLKVQNALNPPRRSSPPPLPFTRVKGPRFSGAFSANSSYVLNDHSLEESEENIESDADQDNAEEPGQRPVSLNKGKGRAPDEGPGIQGLAKLKEAYNSVTYLTDADVTSPPELNGRVSEEHSDSGCMSAPGAPITKFNDPSATDSDDGGDVDDPEQEIRVTSQASISPYRHGYVVDDDDEEVAYDPEGADAGADVDAQAESEEEEAAELDDMDEAGVEDEGEEERDEYDQASELDADGGHTEEGRDYSVDDDGAIVIDDDDDEPPAAAASSPDWEAAQDEDELEGSPNPESGLTQQIHPGQVDAFDQDPELDELDDEEQILVDSEEQAREGAVFDSDEQDLLSVPQEPADEPAVTTPEDGGPAPNVPISPSTQTHVETVYRPQEQLIYSSLQPFPSTILDAAMSDPFAQPHLDFSASLDSNITTMISSLQGAVGGVAPDSFTAPFTDADVNAIFSSEFGPAETFQDSYPPDGAYSADFVYGYPADVDATGGTPIEPLSATREIIEVLDQQETVVAELPEAVHLAGPGTTEDPPASLGETTAASDHDHTERTPERPSARSVDSADSSPLERIEPASDPSIDQLLFPGDQPGDSPEQLPQSEANTPPPVSLPREGQRSPASALTDHLDKAANDTVSKIVDLKSPTEAEYGQGDESTLSSEVIEITGDITVEDEEKGRSTGPIVSFSEHVEVIEPKVVEVDQDDVIGFEETAYTVEEELTHSSPELADPGDVLDDVSIHTIEDFGNTEEVAKRPDEVIDAPEPASVPKGLEEVSAGSDQCIEAGDAAQEGDTPAERDGVEEGPTSELSLTYSSVADPVAEKEEDPFTKMGTGPGAPVSETSTESDEQPTSSTSSALDIAEQLAGSPSVQSSPLDDVEQNGKGLASSPARGVGLSSPGALHSTTDSSSKDSVSSATKDNERRSPTLPLQDAPPPPPPPPPPLPRLTTYNLYRHHHGPVPKDAPRRQPTLPVPTPQGPAPQADVSSRGSTPSFGTSVITPSQISAAARDPNAAVTRSHCRFFKIAIPIPPGVEDEKVDDGPAVDGDGEQKEAETRVVKFIVPRCTLSAHEIIKEEGIELLGDATDQENEMKVLDLATTKIDPAIINIVRIMVGVHVLEACAWLPTPEELMKYTRELEEEKRAPQPTPSSISKSMNRRKSATSGSKVRKEPISPSRAGPSKSRKSLTKAPRLELSEATESESASGSDIESPKSDKKRRRTGHQGKGKGVAAEHRAYAPEDDENGESEADERPAKKLRRTTRNRKSAQAVKPEDAATKSSKGTKRTHGATEDDSAPASSPRKRTRRDDLDSVDGTSVTSVDDDQRSTVSSTSRVSRNAKSDRLEVVIDGPARHLRSSSRGPSPAPPSSSTSSPKKTESLKPTSSRSLWNTLTGKK